MKRMAEEQIAEIIKLYGEGMSPAEIGEKFGILNNSVTRMLRKRGIDRNQLTRVPQDQINLIIEEYNKGVSSEVIAEKLNIDGSTVCRILKRYNIPVRGNVKTENQDIVVSKDHKDN